MLDRVPPESWPAVRSEIYAAINQYRVGDEIRFGAVVVAGSGEGLRVLHLIVVAPAKSDL